MTDFVAQCREEWRRLGVPDPVADDMADELGSDLREAAAEGISIDELLGASASDPRSFATAWASERGIIPTRSTDGNARRRPAALIAFTATAAVTVLVATLLLLTGEPRVSLVTRTSHTPPVLPLHGVNPGGALHMRTAVTASAAAPIEWVLLLLAIIGLAFAAWLWTGQGRARAPRLSG